MMLDSLEENGLIPGAVVKPLKADQIVIDPSLQLYHIAINPPGMAEYVGDLERINLALNEQGDIGTVTAGLKILQTLQSVLRSGKWEITCAVLRGNGQRLSRIVRVWPGKYTGPAYGLAVDLGSTTIAAHLCCLSTGEVRKSVSILNPQIRFGADVMTRVSYSMMHSDGAAEMTTLARDGVNEVIARLVDDGAEQTDLILDTVVVCNPIMHHLFLGIDPVELGVAPFISASSSAISVHAKELGINVHPDSEIFLLPFVGSHVGADGAAVILSEEPEKSDEITLIVDIGTNAEIFLGNSNKLLSTSSPTGPALEGAEIKNGQRAANGAIERVRIHPETREPRFKIIGSDVWSDDADFERIALEIGVTGICGSGIIELVSEMRVAGIIDASGLIGSASQTGSSRCVENGRTFSYRLWSGATPIYISNNDIREVQMAKAALFASIQVLMDEFGTTVIDRIILAGAFGNHLSAKHAMILGLIPDCNLENVRYAGNAAGTGATIALLNRTSRTQIETTIKRIRNVETAIDPRFQQHFSDASSIPNARIEFPSLRNLVSFPELNFHSQSRRKRAKKKDIEAA